MKEPWILASGSPRRRELLAYITKDFVVIPADVEEYFPGNIPLTGAPEFLAKLKASAVAAQYPGRNVIGCDTGVFIDGEMLGKPHSEEEAKAMLRRLSGRTHSVITGCALCRDDKVESFSVETKVRFYELSEQEIDDYVATGDPMDKAGAYGIQSEGAHLVKGIEGDFYTVMGFPVAEMYRKMKSFEL